MNSEILVFDARHLVLHHAENNHFQIFFLINISKNNKFIRNYR